MEGERKVSDRGPCHLLHNAQLDAAGDCDLDLSTMSGKDQKKISSARRFLTISLPLTHRDRILQKIKSVWSHITHHILHVNS